MSRVYLCSECVATGASPDDDLGSNDMLVACAACGAIDEQATYARNAVDTHERFGSLMNDGLNIQFHEYDERKHEEFVDRLLDIYLADPTSRLVDRPGDHFKAGAKTWYNRYRQHEHVREQYKKVSTNNSALKVKYLVAVAVHVAILESNVSIVNNRLAHVKPLLGNHVPASRGDGSIMAPSLGRIFARAQSLGPTHIGHLESLSLLRATYNRFKEVRGAGPSALETTLAHVYVISQHFQFLARLPHDVRRQHLICKDLKPVAVRKRKMVDSADPDDFILGNEEWEYVSQIDWSRAFEMSFHLYCVQQVVGLWGNRCSVDMGIALLQWAIMATVGTPMPSVSAWSKEIGARYGGTEVLVSRRREEIKDLIIGWSTSFPQAGIAVPLIPSPRRGTIGTGLAGYGSDKRRPIPEMVMAIAAAPVVAHQWRVIMETRLRTRTRALPLDTEFTMAARMFAAAYNRHSAARQKQAEAVKMEERVIKEREVRMEKLQAKLAKRAASVPSTRHGSRHGSRYSSRSPSVSFMRGGSRAASQPPQVRTVAAPPPQSPSLEALLATREDSSDDDAGRDSDDEDSSLRSANNAGELGLDGVPSVPFGFSIGPNGFSVATDGSAAQSTVPVGLRVFSHDPRKRSVPESLTSDDRSVKRRKGKRPVAPMSPPPTSPSTQTLSPSTRRSQPSLSPAPSDATVGFRPSSPTPSLRSVTMSPSLTTVSVGDLGSWHIGCLLRERPQYAYYSPYNEQRSGAAVSPEVERAMNAWVAEAKTKGIIPAKITPQYLAQLGFQGSDPRLEDLGPFIRAHPQWSPTECLLRLGVRPVEFPVHLVVHSMLDLEQQLGHFRWEHRLAPFDSATTPMQRDAELDTLFAHGEKWADLIATPAEAARKEKLYRKSGAWSYPRDVPEGVNRRLDENRPAVNKHREPLGFESERSFKTSKRIDMSVLGRLVREEGEGEGDEEDEEDEGIMGDVLHETLWSALGGEGEYEDEDAEYEDDDE